MPKIKRPRVTEEEIKLVRSLALRAKGVTIHELEELHGMKPFRSRLVLSKIQGVVTSPIGTAAGRGARALIYRLAPPTTASTTCSACGKAVRATPANDFGGAYFHPACRS